MKRLGLDPYPGDAEILRRIEAQRLHLDVAVPKPARGRPMRAPTRYPSPYFKAAKSADGHFTWCEGIIYGPARTKKNSTTLGIKQSPAYKRWCAAVVNALSRNYSLPTPPSEPWGFPTVPLNLKAHFYVDSKGLHSDLVGLLQGFCDALQEARIVTDDVWIMAFDGSRKLTYDTTHPRVQFWITPL